jgi:hemin uptake protein HemP
MAGRGPMKVTDLMGQDPVIELDHDGQIYRLRITRNRKLILTK